MLDLVANLVSNWLHPLLHLFWNSPTQSRASISSCRRSSKLEKVLAESQVLNQVRWLLHWKRIQPNCTRPSLRSGIRLVKWENGYHPWSCKFQRELRKRRTKNSEMNTKSHTLLKMLSVEICLRNKKTKSKRRLMLASMMSVQSNLKKSLKSQELFSNWRCLKFWSIDPRLKDLRQSKSHYQCASPRNWTNNKNLRSLTQSSSTQLSVASRTPSMTGHKDFRNGDKSRSPKVPSLTSVSLTPSQLRLFQSPSFRFSKVIMMLTNWTLWFRVLLWGDCVELQVSIWLTSL